MLAILGTSVGRTATFALLSAVAVALAFTGGFWRGWKAADAGKVVAVSLAVMERDADWQRKLAAESEQHEAELSEALAASARVPVISGGHDALIRLCSNAASSADCREKERYRMSGVRKP